MTQVFQQWTLQVQNKLEGYYRLVVETATYSMHLSVEQHFWILVLAKGPINHDCPSFLPPVRRILFFLRNVSLFFLRLCTMLKGSEYKKCLEHYFYCIFSFLRICAKHAQEWILSFVSKYCNLNFLIFYIKLITQNNGIFAFVKNSS